MGYYLLGYTLSEAIYQTIITIATVGFEELHPLGEKGMWLTTPPVDADNLFVVLGTKDQINQLIETLTTG